MSEEIDIEKTMLETIEKADIKDELFDLADAGIHRLIESKDILSEIPYIKSLFAIKNVVVAYRDIQLIKKLLHFLKEINSVSDTDKANMWHDLHDLETRRKVGEHLFTLLDKVESTEKADYLGRLFKCYTQKKINSSELLRMTMVVSTLITSDLKQLPTYITEQKSKYYSPALHSMGLLVRTSGFENTGKDVEEDGYEISALGKQLVELLEFEYSL